MALLTRISENNEKYMFCLYKITQIFNLDRVVPEFLALSLSLITNSIRKFKKNDTDSYSR